MGPAATLSDETQDETQTEPHSRGPHAALLVGVFALVGFVMAFRDVTKLGTFVAGDSGDSLLNIWIMRSVQHGLPNGWDAMWNAPIFHPATRTLAYSDTLFPIALVHWPLRLLFGDVLAFNVIYLSAWTLSAWCGYRLAIRVVDDWRAAVVGALAYTYSTIAIVHHGHFQLVVGSALFPLTVLALLRCLDAPSWRRGALLGLSFAALALSASYYGAMAAVIIVVVGLGWMWSLRPESLRAHIGALLAAAAVVVVLVGPFAYEYVKLQRHSEFRRGFDPNGAAHVQDYLATGSDNYVLSELPVIESRSQPASRGIENRLFPGVIAFGFGAIGVVLTIGRLRRETWRRGSARDLVLLAVAGAICAVLAFGDRFILAGHKIPLPFIAFRKIVPGFAGIRATARLDLAAQLALALFAAVGVAWLLAKLSTSRTKWLVAGGLAALVLVEGATALFFVRVPTAADNGGIDAALRARPSGVVLELPIHASASGVAWPYVETPRQLEALRDGRPRVNGYSGFQPKGFDARAKVLNQFPQPAALAEAKRLGVRYVVVRTAMVGDLSPSVLEPLIDVNGKARYSDIEAAKILGALPVGSTAVQLPGGYLIDLGA